MDGTECRAGGTGAPPTCGLCPALVYVFEKTGLLVTEQNQYLIPDNDLADWDAAIEEYESQ